MLRTTECGFLIKKWEQSFPVNWGCVVNLISKDLIKTWNFWVKLTAGWSYGNNNNYSYLLLIIIFIADNQSLSFSQTCRIN